MSLCPQRCSVHNHSTFCDGKASPEEMAQAAWDAGVRYFGISGHSHTPVPHDKDIVMPADLTAYHEALLRLRTQWEGRMEVLFGIEQDSCTQEPVPDFVDYWIGSVHNLFDPATGAYHAMDWDAEKLALCRDEMFGGDALAMAEGYYRDVAEMAARKPTIQGHIDLITKLNADGCFFDEESRRYRWAALEALHAIDPDATLLEINTGAMSRGYRTVPYPALFLLREWHTMGGRIILTADAHATKNVVFGFGEAAELARAAGFRNSVLLTRTEMIDCPL